MNDIIDQAINSANEARQAEKVEAQPIPEGTSNEEVVQGEEPVEQDGLDQEEIPFPKKAINALNRKDKKITKLQAQYEAAMRELDAIKQKNQKPIADDFNSFDEYIDALIDHRAANKASNSEVQQQQFTPQQIQEQVYYEQKAVALQTKASELSQKLPDFNQVRDANSDVLDALPIDIVKAVYEADNAPLALYVLAKENKLEGLSDMSPTRAAMELARAEIRGQQFLQKKQTNAPAPVTGVKAKSNPNSRGLESMDADELLKWARAKK